MKCYGASTLQELEQEYKVIKLSIEKSVAYNCYEAEFMVENHIYTIQYTQDQKLLGIWDKDGGKIEKI